METPGRFLFTPALPSFPQPLRHSRNPKLMAIRHSRGRGNPEKNKAPRPSPSPHPSPDPYGRFANRPDSFPRTLREGGRERSEQGDARNTATTCQGGRERSEQGDARNSPQYPRHVIPADAGTQRKTKHAIHPNTPPQKPNHQPVSQFVPQFKTKPCTSTYMVLPNCTSHFYLTSTALLY